MHLVFYPHKSIIANRNLEVLNALVYGMMYYFRNKEVAHLRIYMFYETKLKTLYVDMFY